MPDNEEFHIDMEPVIEGLAAKGSLSDEELQAAMQASIEETLAKREEGTIEVMRLGRWRWKYRFYWGRHQAQGPVVAWIDYESGVRMTRNWAFVAGAWHLARFQTKAARTWET